MSRVPWGERPDCRLCGARGPEALFVAARSGRRVARCRGCGLVFYDPQPSPAQTAALYGGWYFEEKYPDAGAADELGLARRRLARIERQVPVGSLLDVGCGRGRFLAAALERGWKAAGLDLSPAAVRLARAAGAAVFEGELTGPRPPGLGPVDVLTLWDVLEHLTDPVAALLAAPAWLKPGGLLLVQTQNVNSVTAAWMGRRWEQFEEFHLYHFSPATLGRALARAGFTAARIEDVEAFLGGPSSAPPPVFPARRALQRLRDALWVAAGHDRFNVMVATARRPGE